MAIKGIVFEEKLVAEDFELEETLKYEHFEQEDLDVVRAKLELIKKFGKKKKVKK